MKRKDKRILKIILGSVISIFLGGIAWTNESIDYLGKLGIIGINPSYVFLITTFLFLIAAAFTFWEIIFDRRKR